MAWMTLILLVTSFLRLSLASPRIEGLDQRCYAIQRDLNLVLFSGIVRRVPTDKTLQCSADPHDVPYMQSLAYHEAFIYAIERINSRSELLPNISLGFIVLDYCYQDLAGLALSLYLTPDEQDGEQFPDGELLTCATGYKRFRNVVGAVGPGYSRLAVMNVPLLSLFHVPVLLTYASSDELSDKTRFPYSLRLVPPDRFQADAMTDLLLHFKWTYAALLYMEGAYGENGAKQLQKNAKEKGICLAFYYMFPSMYNRGNAREAMEKMMKYTSAKVILAFISRGISNLLAEELLSNGQTGHFQWVGSDAFSWDMTKYGVVFDGAFTVEFNVGQSPGFRSYYHSLNPMNSSNPWMPFLWEKAYDCTWSNNRSNQRPCHEFTAMTDSMRLSPLNTPEINVDGVNVFAHALHSLILANCPEAFENKTLLRDCVKGDILLSYLHNTSQDGHIGPISFDENGDFLGSYKLLQYQEAIEDFVTGAVWDRLTGSLHVNENSIRWFSHLNINNVSIEVPPESVCSRPCGPRQYYIQKELPCCWDCRECRDNEVLVGNKSGCLQCELLTWPDEHTATFCVNITPTLLQWSNPLCVTIITLSSLGVLACLLISIIFIRNNQVKIIKASSHQLMAIILAGIMVAFLTALVFLVPPSMVTCLLTRFGFNLAVSLIYCPLVVKTSRVYRIFSAGKKGSKKPKLIGMRSQILMVVTLLLVQVSLCVTSILMTSPVPEYRMPVVTSRYVEVVCRLPLSALLPPLSFNVVLSLTCAVYGFLTRRLPANFNESWFMFVSVATTSFLWLVFLPTYFTAFYASHQVALLAFCLVLNGGVTLVCLYLPKVYCLYFVDETQVEFQMAGTLRTNTVVPVTSNMHE